MDDLSRSEYPAMLATLQPGQAVAALNDRIKRINKVNTEIAEWLQERRKIEEQYVAGLRKLLLFKVPNPASELGVFQAPWDRILHCTDAIAASHHLYATRIEKDVELPLRGFHQKKEMVNMNNISGNLQIMAKELEDAQDKSERLNKKGGKANAQKVEAATARLESATQQWESQAPFVFETLQALDEQRVNHLRDVLTQYETHEGDQATRTQATAEEALNLMLEINTAQEIQNFVTKTTAGRPKLEPRRTATRQNSVVAASTLAPPSTIVPHEDDNSDHSIRNEPSAGSQPESRLRSRIGTMLGRRRQSVHGGFGQLSPSKGAGPFSRGLSSSHGRSVSPRTSSQNLGEPSNRLSSLAETPDTPKAEKKEKSAHDGTNGTGADSTAESSTAPVHTVVNGTITAEDIFDAPPLPIPADKKETAEPVKDADGFTVPPPKTDPISEAQKEAAAEESDQLFKLSIQKEPVAEEDADAKMAAMSNVANTLSMAMPSRKGGTVRGRRDVRNTIYVPAPAVPESSTVSDGPIPVPSPSLSSTPSRPLAVAALASEASLAGTSDTQSVRSATSLGALPQAKHPEMHAPGLNSSIIETVSAMFEDGVPKSAKIAGEIAFSYGSSGDSSAKDHETIRINNFSALEVIGPNRIFVSNTPSPDEFTLATSHLSKTSIAFTYRAHADTPSSLAEHCPLAMQPAWKPNGDKLGFVLQYRLNPTFVGASGRTVTLHNVVFVVTYTGGRASGAQTKPAGTHLKDKHLVYWRVGDVTLSSSWAKIVCRVVGEQNAEPLPGAVEARWEYAVPDGSDGDAGTGISVSRLGEGKGKEKAVEDDPFADEGVASPRTAEAGAGSWVDVPLVKKLVSGKYEAK